MNVSSSSSSGGPYLRMEFQPTQQHIITTPGTIEIDRNLFPIVNSLPLEVEANFSSRSLKVNGELISDISSSSMDVIGASGAIIRGRIRAEVYEGQDVMLTFVVKAYPPLRNQSWATPAHVRNYNSTVFQETYTTNGYRLACYVYRLAWSQEGLPWRITLFKFI